MDFLNKSFEQLKDLFDGMTPGSRITAGLLLVVVVVSLGYLFTHAVPGNNVYLLDGRSFSGSELAAMEAALGDAGLTCETDGGRIRVPSGKKYIYMAALAQAEALPKEFGEDVRNTLEKQSVFGNWKLTQEQLKAATLREMAKIIGAMPGVERATVLYSREEKEGWLENDVVTATVNVAMLGSKAVDKGLVVAICSTIMGGVGGIEPENIRVVDNTNGITFQGNTEDLAGGAGGSLATDTQNWRKYYQDSIRDSLRDIRGVTVSCNVTLSTEKSRIEESIGHDPKTIAVQMAEKTSTRSFEGAEPAGRPGAVAQANVPRSLGTSQGRGSKEDADESELEQSSIALKSTQTKTVSAGRTLQRVSASIGIPSTYFEDVWHQINDKPDEDPKTPDPNDLDQLQQAKVAEIETAVAQLLPEVEGVDDLTELVDIRVFSQIALAPIPTPGMATNALTWLGQSWQTLGLIILAFFSLLMIRSMVKSMPAVEVAEAPAAGSGSVEEDESGEQLDGPRLVSFGTSGKSLKDEVSDLVAEDPDAAANVLKNWIGHVASVG